MDWEKKRHQKQFESEKDLLLILNDQKISRKQPRFTRRCKVCKRRLEKLIEDIKKVL